MEGWTRGRDRNQGRKKVGKAEWKSDRKGGMGKN